MGDTNMGTWGKEGHEDVGQRVTRGTHGHGTWGTHGHKGQGTRGTGTLGILEKGMRETEGWMDMGDMGDTGPWGFGTPAPCHSSVPCPVSASGRPHGRGDTCPGVNSREGGGRGMSPGRRPGTRRDTCVCAVQPPGATGMAGAGRGAIFTWPCWHHHWPRPSRRSPCQGDGDKDGAEDKVGRNQPCEWGRGQGPTAPP